MEQVVISIGGSVLVPGKDDVDYIKSLAELLLNASAKCKLFVVTGGGRIARYYINLGRDLGIEEQNLDELGIEATRLNAKLLILALGDGAYPKPALDVKEAAQAGNNHKIVVMGGTVPGHTTDAVSAMIAEKIGAQRLVNATNVNGIYDSDPKQNSHAKRFDKMSYDQLKDISSANHDKAGPNVIFDPKGTRIIAREKIPLFVCNGRDLHALKKSILGEEFDGTIVG
ncbi:MAG: UMP kinase [Methanomassiliicoccales archaeon]|nr:MAG: UMP kinase [Methanomassiliicoccales archaeon]